MMWDLRASDLIFLFLDHVQKKQKAQRPAGKVWTVAKHS